MQMYRGYEYFIFTDEDVELRENRAINSTIPFSGEQQPLLRSAVKWSFCTESLSICLSGFVGNAWRNFVNYLDKYKPPVAYPSFYWKRQDWNTCVSPDSEIDTIYW